MLHVSCDLCGKELKSSGDQRYVVKIEVFAARNPAEITEEDLDIDNMEAVSELLDSHPELLAEADGAEARSRHLRYDLCPECQKKFLRDPLNRDRELDLHFNFSEN